MRALPPIGRREGRGDQIVPWPSPGDRISDAPRRAMGLGDPACLSDRVRTRTLVLQNCERRAHVDANS